ncbi:protein translocase subunit SecDF [Tunicatimonas pelagia]|uniref:protein translocase subunit SecDF n=1 Tax=Tunicatimonas pelagia TaxID=931531 RepID=UPI002666526E|nr:protein translocase subunit SecDF [Tunicatimonas pelagia]WKN45224.1 protein translocase subunit SecDF [Tunicatimonas pelagia]
MRNRSGIVILTVLVSLLCIYYLSFTVVSNQVQKKAETYATDAEGNIDFAKKQDYLDSVWTEPVYNLLGIEYTYEEVKETELNLGLDLRGGMHVVLEVSPTEIIRALSGDNKDADFLQALDLAQERRVNSQERFTTLFADAFQEVAPNKPLSQIFANAANRGRISRGSTNDEVMEIIDEEVENAIDRSFNILRTRIDRFGTSQPNIQRLQGTGRIQVELPGVDNPERVRKLLQGVAKLEFLQVYNSPELGSAIQAINNLLVSEMEPGEGESLADALADEGEDDLSDLNPTEDSETLEGALDQDDVPEIAENEGEDDLEAQLSGADADSTALDSMINSQVSPLYSLVQNGFGGLAYRVEDTAKINDIFQREDVQSLLPSDLSLAWQVKPDDEQNPVLQLYTLQRGRGGKAPLTGEVVTNARQDYDQNARPAVSMQMNAEGTRLWRRLTANSVGQQIAIVLDNRVYSAPVVNEEIPSGSSIISGNFEIQEAQDLANILEAGALPAPTRIVEEAIVGPTLGRLAIKQGVTSILVGLGLVVIFMIIYYAKGGLVANVALLFNIFFVLGILAQPTVGAALTLPGIAGIVLTIGMAIDANVLIFERIREELRNGMRLKAAIKTGYNKAYSSIIDSNATTFLTALILFIFGQGPVRGFAVTLMIGIICSFFSAVFITRVIIEWMTRKGDESKVSFSMPFSGNLLNNLNFDFMSKRRIAYIFSGAFIGLGLIALISQPLNLGVDFKGGRSYVVTFDEAVVPSDLMTSLSDDFEDKAVEVKTFGATNVLKITTSYLVGDESDEADTDVRQRLLGGITEFTGGNFVENTAELGENQFTISSSSKVGATIADDILNASLEAIVFSLIVIFLYILIRFRKWQYSTGAIIALFHDVLFVLGAYAIAGLLGVRYEVDQVFIAAMLTIVGYSINDTVIVFDRIRETLGVKPRLPLEEAVNESVNNVMSRTLITSLTTLLVVFILLVFGGEVLRGFSFALFIGILVGTYSSVYIASPVVVDLTQRRAEAPARKPQKA